MSSEKILNLVEEKKLDDLITFLSTEDRWILPTNVSIEQWEYMQQAYIIGWKMKYVHKDTLKKLCKDSEISLIDISKLCIRINGNNSSIKNYISKNKIDNFVEFPSL